MPSSAEPLLRRYRAEIGVAVIGVLLVLLLWLGNRGGDGDGGAVSVGSTTSTVLVTVPEPTEDTAPAAVDPGSLDEVAEQDATGESAGPAQAVIQLADLPAGWERRTGVSRETEICPNHDPLAAGGSTGSARSVFRNGTSFIVGLVADFAGPTEAQAFLESARTSFRSCQGFVVDAVTDLGDEATLGRRDADREGLTAETRVYVARVGSRVAAVSAVSFDGLDSALVRRLVLAEVRRL